MVLQFIAFSNTVLLLTLFKKKHLATMSIANVQIKKNTKLYNPKTAVFDGF